MKYILILQLFLICSCTTNNYEGHVYDYDTSKPVRNVEIIIKNETTKTDSLGYFSLNANAKECELLLRKEGYAAKRILRRPNNAVGSKKMQKDIIYIYKKDSDFSLKKR